MRKYLIIIAIILSTLTFSQELPTQKQYLRKTLIRKYLIEPVLFPIHKINNLLKNETKDYDLYMSKPLDDQYNYQWNQSTAARCDQVCPNNLDILKYNSYNQESSEANSLSFLNLKNYFDDIIEKEYGFCWGHATMTNALRHLAFFDPYNESKTTNLEYQSEEWKKYVRDAIKDIYYHKPRIIPYIHNIRELSELFETELKNYVIQKWGDNAVSISQYFDRFDNKKTYEIQEIQEMMKELDLRLKTGQTPEIIFNIWDSDIWIHVVLVKHLEYNPYDYTYTLYLDDNKVFNNASALAEYESTVIIDLKDQSITYNNSERFKAPSATIGRIELTKANYKLYNKILPKLKLFCEQHSGCSQN